MDGINWNGLNNINRTMPGNTIQPQPIPMPTQPQVQLPLLSVIYLGVDPDQFIQQLKGGM